MQFKIHDSKQNVSSLLWNDSFFFFFFFSTKNYIQQILTHLAQITVASHFQSFLQSGNTESDADVVHRPKFYSFTPKFLTWTFPSLNLETSIIASRGVNQKLITECQTV